MQLQTVAVSIDLSHCQDHTHTYTSKSRTFRDCSKYSFNYWINPSFRVMQVYPYPWPYLDTSHMWIHRIQGPRRGHLQIHRLWACRRKNRNDINWDLKITPIGNNFTRIALLCWPWTSTLPFSQDSKHVLGGDAKQFPCFCRKSWVNPFCGLENKV